MTVTRYGLKKKKCIYIFNAFNSDYHNKQLTFNIYEAIKKPDGR